MSLIVKLAEGSGSGGGSHKDKITLKAEIESPISIKRGPIIIPLPGGSIVGLDLGKNYSSISISGVVDYALTELFIDGISGTFSIGDSITGSASWNDQITGYTSPATARTTPTATVVAGYPNLTNPTSLIVSNVTSFFVNNEPITKTGVGTPSALVNEPFPTKLRLEQLSRYWYKSGKMTLTTRQGNYTVYINGMDFSMQAGLEDRYTFRIDFAQASQDI